jgi:DNA topoisomerase IB
MSEAVAKRLHYTATIARNDYIHLDIIELAGQDITLPKPVIGTNLRVAQQRKLGNLVNK